MTNNYRYEPVAKAAKIPCSSFWRKPESRNLSKLKKHWTPVFTGVTAFTTGSYGVGSLVPALFFSLFLISGCATTDDPRQGDFFSAASAMVTGAYEKRLAAKQAQLVEKKSDLEEAKLQAEQTEKDKATTTQELEEQEGWLIGLCKELDDLRTRLQQAEDARQIEMAEKERFELSLQEMSDELAVVTKSQTISIEQKTKRIQELEQRKKKLEKALQAAVGF